MTEDYGTSDTSASSEYLDLSNQVGEDLLHNNTVRSIDCGDWDEYQDPPSFLAGAQDQPVLMCRSI